VDERGYAQEIVPGFGWGAAPATVKLTIPLDRAPKQVREFTTGQAVPHPAAAVHLDTDVPAMGVRVYRIDY
jgi:hypothetical protein